MIVGIERLYLRFIELRQDEWTFIRYCFRLFRILHTYTVIHPSSSLQLSYHTLLYRQLPSHLLLYHDPILKYICIVIFVKQTTSNRVTRPITMTESVENSPYYVTKRIAAAPRPITAPPTPTEQKGLFAKLKEKFTSAKRQPNVWNGNKSENLLRNYEIVSHLHVCVILFVSPNERQLKCFIICVIWQWNF